jgi:hypothetical protein
MIFKDLICIAVGEKEAELIADALNLLLKK